MGKRGTQCTVCSHREASNIDLALARGVSHGIGQAVRSQHR